MSKFQAFFKKENEGIRTKAVYISDRFVDDNGEPVPFVIRSLKASEERVIRDSCTHTDDNGIPVLNTSDYQDLLITAAIVEPDLKDVELQNSYGVVGEVQVLNEMLIFGEYTNLAQAVQDFNGFKKYTDRVEEAKN